MRIWKIIHTIADLDLIFHVVFVFVVVVVAIVILSLGQCAYDPANDVAVAPTPVVVQRAT
jgi:cell division protein FtsL